MSKSKLVLALTLLLGGGGAALRMWHRASGYDAAGLPVSGAPSALALLLFLVLCAAACLLFALRQGAALPDGQSAAPRGVPAAVVLALAGALLLAGGLLHLRHFSDTYVTYSQMAKDPDQSRQALSYLLANSLPLVMALASVPAAAALFYQARRAKAGGQGPLNSFAVLMPPLFAWLWLIEAYRGHTSNPILWDYVLLLLAAVLLLLSGYSRAGFCFGLGRTRSALAGSMLALILALAALPDAGDSSTALVLIALALHTAVELYALLSCFNYRPRRLAAQQSAQQEEPPHEQ